MTADFVNAVFEFGGFIMVALNCVAVYRDKGYAGVTIPTTVFFAVWGYWNLYYYQSLDQLASWGAAGLVAAANTFWIILMLNYGKRS